tara:strand:+ start:310 stop:750 length:441 start_codon:yes stop_codon:yes gene_type:complete
MLLSLLFVNCSGGGDSGGGDDSSTTTKYNYSETASDHKTTEYNNQYGLASIKAAEGYAALGGYTEGGPIKVAVLDTGIDSDHSQLDGQIASGGYDYVNSDSDPEDNQVGGIGHGTHVSGIIAAELTGTGMHGVCPNCDIIPIKVMN